MLILTRKQGESLIIRDDITITIVTIKGNQVRIGIDAPKNVAVDREEIWVRKKTEEIESKKRRKTDVKN